MTAARFGTTDTKEDLPLDLMTAGKYGAMVTKEAPRLVHTEAVKYGAMVIKEGLPLDLMTEQKQGQQQRLFFCYFKVSIKSYYGVSRSKTDRIPGI